MGEDDHGPLGGQPVDRLADGQFSLHVEVTRRLIEDHEPGRSQQRPSDRQSASLPSGQTTSSGADHGIQTLGQRRHLGIHPHGHQRVVEGCFIGLGRHPEGHDLTDRAPEWSWGLGDPRAPLVPGPVIDIGQVHAPQEEAAAVGRTQPQQHRSQGGLARTRGPQHRQPLPRRHGQVDGSQGGGGAPGIGDGDTLEVQGHPRRVRHAGHRRVRYAGHRRAGVLLQQVEQAVRGSRPVLVGVELLADLPQRPESFGRQQQGDQHGLEADAGPLGQSDPGDHRHGGDPECLQGGGPEPLCGRTHRRADAWG